MNSLKSFYPEIREILQSIIPNYWPGLKNPLGRLFEKPILPEAMLPIASCQAVDGQAKDAVPVSAALLAAGLSLRILDDLQDKDRSSQLWSQVGEARAWNYAGVSFMLSFDILSKAPFSPQLFQSINQTFIEAALRMAAGQDLDLAGETKTIEDYWLTIEMKTGAGYGAACVAGAMVGTDNPKLIQACGTFGHHLGLAIQIFNDMDSIWDPNGITDLKQGKVTLPLIYGLTTNHPDRDELKALVKSDAIASHGERIKEILDRIDTRAFLIWAALKERDQALEAIRICPNAEGKEVLESYITGMFGDIDSLLQEAEADNYYKSPALQLRNQLRS